MNADKLLAHFDKISDAPDALDRLRRFVLNWATLGRLSSCETQTPCQVVRVGEVAQLQNGYAFKSQWFKPNGIRLLRNANVGHGRLDWSEAVCLSPDQAAEYERFELAEGDIVLSLDRPFISTGVKVARVTRDDLPSLLLQRVGRFVIQAERLDADYLYRWLKSPSFAAQVDPGRSLGVPHISSKHVENAEIPLPPLAEQHRIVEKVDELIMLCDRLEASQAERETRRTRLVVSSLNRLGNPTGSDPDEFKKDAGFHLRNLNRLSTKPEHIKELRKAILNLAVRGKLVPQEEKGNSAAELPSGWHQYTIADLLDGDSQNGYSKKPDDDPAGVPILRISAATVRSDCIIAEEEFKLIGGISTQHQSQFALMPGDLLACRFNGNKNYVGRMAEYRASLGKQFVYPDKLIRLRLNREKAIPALVRRFGQSDIVRHEIEQHCATTVGNWGISATNLKAVTIPLPPLSEQKRIVAKVDELMAICDQLEKQLESQQKESRRLLEALLHEALEGVG